MVSVGQQQPFMSCVQRQVKQGLNFSRALGAITVQSSNSTGTDSTELLQHRTPFLQPLGKQWRMQGRTHFCGGG